MKLELKAIKHSEFNSQETNCFEAKIYLDGKAWAHISNHGHGGPDHMVPINGAPNDPDFWAKVKEINAELNASEEGARYRMDAVARHGDIMADMEFDIEAWVANTLSDHLIRKDMKRVLNRKAAFIKDGAVYTLGYKKGKPDQALFDEVAKRHPNAPILNTMDEAEALKLWKAHG